MYNDGVSIGRVGEFDSSDKGKKFCGMVWYFMVRLVGEVELFYFTDFIVFFLCK